MGKTKIKTIDADTSDKKPVRKLGRQDELVERLKKELEADEPTAKQEKPKSVKKDVILGTNEVRTPESTQEDSGQARMTKEKKSQKPGKSKPRSKKYQEVVKDLDKSKTYPLTEAVELTKKLSYSKFTGTLEAHINTISTGMRGLISLPFVSGKKLQILVFGPSTSLRVEDGITLGNDHTIEEINKGKVNFDLIITTPEWMPKLTKVARILGPRGLMPNPKNGTITDDLKKAVESFQGGKTEYERSSKMIYKTEQKAPVIHLGLGKLNQPTEELSANIKTLLQTLGKTRIKKVTLSPTMGPSVKLDLSSL